LVIFIIAANSSKFRILHISGDLTLNKNYNRPREQAIYPSLAGKRVVITGGGSGIGAGIVEAFALQGARSPSRYRRAGFARAAG
jgi:FlaA1/EpsC-like NDP-sugar epimerase